MGFVDGEEMAGGDVAGDEVVDMMAVMVMRGEPSSSAGMPPAGRRRVPGLRVRRSGRSAAREKGPAKAASIVWVAMRGWLVRQPREKCNRLSRSLFSAGLRRAGCGRQNIGQVAEVR